MSYIVGMDLTANDASPKFKLGAIGQDADGYLYKYVQYNAGVGAVAAVANNAAYYYAAGGVSAGSSTVVTSDLSDSAELGAGILMAALTTLYYGWIKVKGRHVLNTALTAGADGDPLTPTGATDGTLDVVAAATDAVCAYAVDASAKIVLCDFPI